MKLDRLVTGVGIPIGYRRTDCKRVGPVTRSLWNIFDDDYRAAGVAWTEVCGKGGGWGEREAGEKQFSFHSLTDISPTT